MYEEVTRDILIRVRPAFLEEESEPEEGRYVWAYTIEIENKGAETVQLMSREWRITDAFNQWFSKHGVVSDKAIPQTAV